MNYKNYFDIEEPLSKLYTPEEAAALLRLTPRTLRKYMQRGECPASKIGNKWYLTKGDIQEFIDSRKNDYIAKKKRK